MAGSVNKVIILGNLGANPEVKYLPSGQAVCEMRVATTEVYKDKNEQRQERTEWHKIVVWGKTGENCGKYLQKGQQVYVEGRLQTRSWDDKEGNKRYMTEIVGDQVVFLRGGGGGGGAPGGPGPEEGSPSRQSGSYGGGGGGYGGGGGGGGYGGGGGGGANYGGGGGGNYGGGGGGGRSYGGGYGGGGPQGAPGGGPGGPGGAGPTPAPSRGRAPTPAEDAPPPEDFGGSDDDIPF